MYCVRNVTDDLYWVGANDHRLALFENIHPIPDGVSYNSYLLLDQSSVLFDTVDWSACRQLLENIEYLLDGKPLDYLLINHMEPDHGASIEEIILRYPDVKLIASEKAFKLMDQFGFRVAKENCIAVKNGDTFSFGKHTVTFIAAPMVHWPEVIVTFDLTDGILFSADAFGTFGALDGKLFNDEVNFDRDWIDEARRYYTNIVGKYGMQTQSLIKKAGALEKINYICPLHGPVWRNNFDYFIEKHNYWTTYTPEEKGIMIVYASMYGNTESAAQALAANLCSKGMTNVVVHDVSNTHVSYLISEAFKYSHIVIAGVTYNFEIYPVMNSFLHDMKNLNLQNRTFAIIENGSWACKSGTLTQQFIEQSMKKMTVLDEKITITSTLHADEFSKLDALTDALIASVNAAE